MKTSGEMTQDPASVLRVMAGNFQGAPPAIGIAIDDWGTVLDPVEARILAEHLFRFADGTPASDCTWSSQRQSDDGPAVVLSARTKAGSGELALSVAGKVIRLSTSAARQSAIALFEQIVRSEVDGQVLNPDRASMRVNPEERPAGACGEADL